MKLYVHSLVDKLKWLFCIFGIYKLCLAVMAMPLKALMFFLFFQAMDKEMRTWDTYVTLEATVKNMLTSLRAVGELQNAAIRERHWQQLMKSTKVMIQHNLILCFCYTRCHRITLTFAMFGTVGHVGELMVHIFNMYLQ